MWRRDKVYTCHESRAALSNYATFARCGDQEVSMQGMCLRPPDILPLTAIVSLHQIVSTTGINILTPAPPNQFTDVN